MRRPDSSNYFSLFVTDTPLLDIRAPVEFDRGAFPCAVNIPLMDNPQREAVGTRYKTDGEKAALALGYEIVSGELLENRLRAWRQFTGNHPEGYLYCFRGGLRSQLVQQALAEQGVEYPRVTGGYKAMRHYLLELLQVLPPQTDFRVIAGRTGAGKTKVIERSDNSIDLEELANHRGSSFGYHLSPQPSQIDFENQLAIALLKVAHQHRAPLAIEDEGNLIGRCALPEPIKQTLKKGPVVVVNSPLVQRIETIAEEYISQPLGQFQERFGETESWEKFSQSVHSSLDRIKRRLGGLRHHRLSTSFDSALAGHRKGHSVEVFSEWISILLTEYYDPMYDYQMDKNKREILFEGSVGQVLDFLHKERP